jgi:MFS family permease
MVDSAGIALLMHHSPNLSRDVGLLEGASSLGYLLGPLLAGLLYGAVGFRPLFFIFSAPFLALLALACLAPHIVLPGATGRVSKAEAAREAAEEAAEGGSLLRAFRELASTPSYLIYVGLVLLVAGSLGFFDTSLAEHLAVALDVSSFEAGCVRACVRPSFSVISALFFPVLSVLKMCV